MKETRRNIPELGIIAGSRAAGGGGVALFLADKLTKEQRKAVGWTLFLVGAITTFLWGIWRLPGAVDSRQGNTGKSFNIFK